MRLRRSSKRSSGLTLLEVLAALSILGTVLVSVVLSRGRLLEQSLLAERKLLAAKEAEALLSAWWADRTSIPRRGEEALGKGAGLRWRTDVVSGEDVWELRCHVVRLSVLDERRPKGAEPLVSVDLVLPGRVEASIAHRREP